MRYEPQKSTSIIDPDKVAQNPSILPYAHTIGGAIIRPEDQGKIKSKALTVMHQQTGKQLEQLQQQYALLLEQVKHIKERVEVSERIYMAEIRFEPVVGETYYLYQRDTGVDVLSLIEPGTWNTRSERYMHCIAKVTLLADHTWDVEYIKA